jgi:predicted nucleic acid-binding Zn ribbon protein
MKRRAPRPFVHALTDLAERLAPATTLARVQRVWERAAGEMVARSCRPTAERDGVLTVTCSEAVWAQELDLMGSEVIERLNEALGQPLVERLRCRVG